METPTLFSLLALLSSGLCVPPALAFPPHPPHGQQTLVRHETSHERNQRVETVTVSCYPDLMEITVKADMFEIGAPVSPDELRLGVVYGEACGPLASSPDEYKIVVGLSDCGTKHWMTESNLVYTNLLIYTPAASVDGLIRMEEAVIPIECQYDRKYSLSSSPLQPKWIPFTATRATVETLDFSLRIMTSDWLHERGSNIFYLGEPIYMQASVGVANHMDLRVFMSSCVATLYLDRMSTPRYDFVENDGCLVDSQLEGAHSQFLPRTQDDKLRLVIDAFRFHQEEQGHLYITCQLTATPVIADSPQPMLQTKACTYVNDRQAHPLPLLGVVWRSADGNDYFCGTCGGQNEVGYSKPRSHGTFGSLSHAVNSAASTGLTGQVYKEEHVGPILVLPTKKHGFIPKEELPPVLSKMQNPTFYGSQWRSGVASKMGMQPKTDLDKGLVPENLLPSLEHGAHKDLTKDKNNVTSRQGNVNEGMFVVLPSIFFFCCYNDLQMFLFIAEEDDEEASGEEEAVTSFYTTVDVAQKSPTQPSAVSDPPTPQADLRPEENKHTTVAPQRNVTVIPQQNEDQKPKEEKQPKK
ncbi:Zona pellucida sperm-binding protein 3 [Merluccius polli]|uniref:Zona pellucida sperm-binding protein 3 n=1 Tax=Merluccius polli TaxID=89951 RepID=A0AA47N378_MERPO|nr:Zona pellucida sperm-binding protein 3 [Merluccius polli]